MVTGAMIAMLLAGAPPEPCLTIPVAFDPAMQAEGKSWYINNEPITVLDHKYVKYGLPRQLQPGDVTLLAAYQGVLVAVEPKAPTVEVAYLLVNMERCEFQPYQFES